MTPALSLIPDELDTIEGAGAALRSGRITCVGLVDRCLDAIERWEPTVQAWVMLQADRALDHARALDRLLADGTDLGPIHGIPIGVKDIIDVRGLTTKAGATRWSTGPAEADAPIVRALGLAGAVILGKTATTAYAYLDPAPTRNPWDLDRTPGGSSSGSAVAVATGMCLAALGTQTVGSLTRPASFCAVSSYKPRTCDQTLFGSSWGLGGTVPLAASLDSLGAMARSVAGLEAIQTAVDPRWRTRIDDEGEDEPERDRPTFALFGGIFRDRADPGMTRAMDRAARLWAEAGADDVGVVDPPDGFESLGRAGRTILAVEAAAFHGDRFQDERDDYPPRISELIDEGNGTRGPAYLKARAEVDRWRDRRIARPGVGLIVTPAALGAAPGRETTGSALFNGPWTTLGRATLSIPIGLSSDGLPLAAQFVMLGDDLTMFFRDVAWCERVIRAHLEATGA